MMDDNQSLWSGGGKCFTCKSPLCTHGRNLRPDVSSGGFPCQPFSTARTRSGSTSKTGPTSEHEFFNMVMSEFGQYLDVRKPRSFYIEEVKGFLTPLKALGGRSPCDVFVADCMKRGYGCQVLKLDHRAFIKASRDRVVVVGCGAEDGGMEGALDCRDAVLEMMQFIDDVSGVRGLPSVFEVGVDPRSLQEQRRRRDDSATRNKSLTRFSL